jgi:Domain of unknown function (DUF4440)
MPEREQRDAYLQRDIAKTERLVADEFILTSGRDIGGKMTLLAYLKSSPVDPTFTLTAEDTRVKIDGDTAIVFGRRVERQRREDNNRGSMRLIFERRVGNSWSAHHCTIFEFKFGRCGGGGRLRLLTLN